MTRTADTITDEDIRTMLTGSDLEAALALAALESVSHGDYEGHCRRVKRAARARCAEILNAREQR